MYKKFYVSASLIVLLSLSLMLSVPVKVSAAVPKNTLEIFASELTGPFGITFDKDGNLYVANEGINGDPFISGTTISKITPDGQVSTFKDGFINPAGLAFDNKGNLWVSDDHGSNIWKIAPDGSVTESPNYGFPNPNGLAFDRDGNLFVACTGGELYKISPEGTVSLFFDCYEMLQAVAFDKAGNVFVADGAGTIYKIGPSGTPVEVFSAGILGFNFGGLTFDKEGNLYASGGYDVYEFTSGGIASIILSGFQWVPRGLIFDEIGRLYIAEYDTGIIWRLTTAELRFDALAKGECMVAYGGIGPGVPYPLTWEGLGEGEAKIEGVADNVLKNYKINQYTYSYSNDIKATGKISVGWNEDGVEHHLKAKISSTEATEGVFLPCEELFVVPIPQYSFFDKILEVSATYQSGSETKTFSGGALFSSGIYGPPPYGNPMLIILVDPGIDGTYLTGDDMMYLIAWSRILTPIPSGPLLSATDVYQSNVKTGGMIDYKALPGGTFSQGIGINDLGMVVGVSQTSFSNQPIIRHAFLWTKQGDVVDLGTLQGDGYSQANSINNNGQVVGFSALNPPPIDSATSHAFLWTERGGMVELETLTGYTNSRATSINNLGNTVGASWSISPQTDSHACLWTVDGEIIDLGTLGGARSMANGINDLNQVVGGSLNSDGLGRAFLWTEEGGMVDLGTLGGPTSAARSINNLGMVVGTSSTSSGEQHAFLWTEEGGMVDLGILGGSFSIANSINDKGQIVGYSYTVSGQTILYHAFLWTIDGQIIDLNPTFPSIYGFSSASGINEKGQIVGSWNSPYQLYAGIWDVSHIAK